MFLQMYVSASIDGQHYNSYVTKVPGNKAFQSGKHTRLCDELELVHTMVLKSLLLIDVVIISFHQF